MGLIRYITKRLLLVIPVLLGVTFVTFYIARIAVHDPARAWAGPRANAGALAALSARYHLNSPIYIQYFYYMRDLLSGNWGISPDTGRPVINDISLFFPATIELAIAALIITVLLGISLGVVAALYYNKKVDHSIRFFYLFGFSSPPFFIAILFLFIFGFYFKILPTQGQLSSALSPPDRITGMYIVDSLITGNWVDFWDSLRHIILPAVALSLTYFGVVTRVSRASMAEVLQKEYILACYASGLKRARVIWKHALRNSMIPTVTVLGLLLGSLLGGTIVIETIFSWPGIGYYSTQAILSYNFPAVMGVTVLFTLGVVFANLMADILYAVLDPRIHV